MSSQEFLNDNTLNLPPYPMEELAKIKRSLLSEGHTVYDFGTGDPLIPVWEDILQAMRDGISSLSQYPSILGVKELEDAHKDYLARRFGITKEIMILPTRGSKEAVFHIALSLVGRAGGRKHILYPDPGYPVYRTSALFAGGIPYSIRLRSEDNYLMQPWNLPSHIIKDTAAIWVNYPHNPTGAIASKKYWEQLIDWCQTQNIILLADDCYADIYTSELESSLGKPINALEISTDKVLSFMSLSKRSGFTGYRAGFIAGDPNLLKLHTRARANFGLANPLPIQKAAIVAWNDDTHVEKRRKIFEERLNVLAPFLVNKGLLMEIPKATFYLWCKIPKDFQNDDVGFCLSLANSGIICSPSSWLSEGQKGYFRLALVPETKDIKKAIDLMNNLF